MLKIVFKSIIILMILFADMIAKENPKAIIIFDASGSMWGQIDNVPKITIAKDALKNVVKSWNPDIELGLMVYGHRRKGDCDDIESVVPVGEVDKGKIVKSVMAISPKGKTPISRSLKKAAKELKYTEDKATVILISDGKETCDLDPCATAKELKKQGIDFIAHVIGFNVDKNTDKQLKCIANATGGEYFSAKNATDLNSAIKSVAKKVQIVQPKKLEYNIQITASETKDSPKVKAKHIIYKDINGIEAEKYEYICVSSKKTPCLKYVTPGSYIVVTKYTNYKVKTPVTVSSENNLTKLNVIIGQTGKVFVSASDIGDGKFIGATCTIYNEDKTKTWKVYAKNKDSKLGYRQLKAGKYFLNCRYNSFKKKDIPVEIKVGETTKVHVTFSSFYLKSKCLNSKDRVKYKIYSKDGKYRLKKSVKCSKRVKVTVDEGEYIIEGNVKGMKVKTNVNINSNKTKRVVLDFTNKSYKKEK